MSKKLGGTGEAIRQRLATRGWTQAELARILGWHVPDISNIVRGKRPVTADLAVALSAALGEDPAFWLNLETERQLELLPPVPTRVERRVRLFERAPIRQMKKRGWIAETDDPDEIEKSINAFFETTDLDVEPTLELSPRKQSPSAALNREQLAWAFRAKQIASSIPVPAYRPDRLPVLLKRLRKIAAFPEEAYRVAGAMSEFGVRLVVVEPLAGGGGIDGACFWLDEASPVVALSLRLNRIDGFWHTLFHELSHVKHRDSLSLDAFLVGNDRVEAKCDIEVRADREGAHGLIEPRSLDDFILRVQPFFSEDRIVRFANRIKMHPGVIVGQLQHRGAIKYSAHRKWLVKIRDQVISTAITDGWGSGLRNH